MFSLLDKNIIEPWYKEFNKKKSGLESVLNIIVLKNVYR